MCLIAMNCLKNNKKSFFKEGEEEEKGEEAVNQMFSLLIQLAYKTI